MFARILTALAICLAQPAAADDLFRAPAPPWVDEVAVPDAGISADGIVRLLIDRQFAWQGEELFLHQRTVSRVTEGLGDDVLATRVPSFDPTFETLTLTRLRVLRDGAVIDPGAVSAVIDPDIAPHTVTVEVSDLQVGDTVDIGLLRRSLPRMAGDNRGGVVLLEEPSPVALSRLVLNWPAGWPTYFSGWPSKVSYVAEPGADGTTRHVWTARDAQAPQVPEAAPPGWDGALKIEWSADADWSGIAAALSDHYLQARPLGAWEERVEALRTRYFTDAERAMAALRMVQDEVATVDRPLAAGGFLARSPADVVAEGAGDSKDKALLFHAMLNRLGIESRVALADRDRGHELLSRKPALSAFDGAIVSFDVDDTRVWADPALTHQGGDVWTHVSPDYGYALPLDGPNRQAVEEIPTSWSSSENRSIYESFDFGWAGVHLTVSTTLSGRSADDMRAKLAVMSQDALSDGLLAHYAGVYPGLRRIAAMDVMDDRMYNSISLTEYYFLPATALYGTDLIATFYLGTPDLALEVPSAVEAGRTAPIWLGPVGTYSHNVSITGAPIDFAAPEPVYYSDDAYSYSFEGWPGEPGAMTLTWSFSLNQSEVAPRDAGPVLEGVAAVADNAWFTWDLRAATE